MKDKCVICGRVISGHGHNPAPIKPNGRCCDDCNRMVIIARLERMKQCYLTKKQKKGIKS